MRGLMIQGNMKNSRMKFFKSNRVKTQSEAYRRQWDVEDGRSFAERLASTLNSYLEFILVLMIVVGLLFTGLALLIYS